MTWNRAYGVSSGLTPAILAASGVQVKTGSPTEPRLDAQPTVEGSAMSLPAVQEGQPASETGPYASAAEPEGTTDPSQQTAEVPAGAGHAPDVGPESSDRVEESLSAQETSGNLPGGFYEPFASILCTCCCIERVIK